MKKAATHSATIVLALVTWLWLSGCSSGISREESTKHLKAFDAESMQLAQKITQSESAKALLALRQLANLPLPLQSASMGENDRASGSFPFEQNTGIYVYQQAALPARVVTDTNLIAIRYPFKSKKDSLATFVLHAYEEEPSALAMLMPTKAKADLMIAGHRIATLDYQAVMKHQLPQQASFSLVFSGFELTFSLQTIFHRENASIAVKFKLTDHQTTKLEGTLRSDVERTAYHTLLFSKLEIETAIFPVKIYFTAHEKLNSYAPIDYPDHFNKNTTFYFTDAKGRKLGDVFFTKGQGADRINLSVRYHDGTEQNLEELLLLVKNILNLKIPDEG